MAWVCRVGDAGMDVPGTSDHQSPVAGLRILEFRSPATAFLGRMLVDLGAEVSLVPGRRREQGSADVSAYWEVADFGKAVSTRPGPGGLSEADVVLTSDPWAIPGFGAREWSELLPKTILVSITPFGATGPQAKRPSSDLVNLALGGYLYMTGPEDATPLKPSVPYVSWRHAANHALVGLALALRNLRLTGRSSHVDVAARDTGLWMLTHTYQYWEMEGINLRRKGASRDVGRAGVRIPSVYACRDGTIIWMLLSGQLGKASINRLVAWMQSEDAAPSWLIDVDWETLHLEAIEDIEAFMKPFADFFLTKTKVELLERAVQDGFMIAPANTFEDVLADPQLEARGSWIERELSDGPRKLPRAPVRIDSFGWGSRARST